MTAQTNGEHASLVALLAEDHQALKTLLDQVGQPGVDQAELFSHLVRDLIAHEVAEEEIVYPTLRREVPGGDQLADARIAEQQKAEELLAKMEKMDPNSPEFGQHLQQLKNAVLEHAQAEETQVFPELESHLDDHRLQQLGSVYKLAKATAPTHPHPKAPNQPPGNILLGPIAAIIDRARDAAKAAIDKTRAHT
jgi:hemerythrin superfamily protein